MNSKVKRMSFISLLLAIGVVLHYIEGAIELPFLPLGVKLGFANIVGLIAYYLFGFKVMIGVNMARVIFTSLIRGVIFAPAFYMSLGGVSLSTLLVGIVARSKKLSVVAVSGISAIAHATGQILMAIVVMRTSVIVAYLPIILTMSIPTGIFTGIIADKVLVRIEKNHRIKGM